MRADVVLARCQQGFGSYGIRIEEHPGVWLATWTFPLDEARFTRSGYGDAARTDAPLQFADRVVACPLCEADTIVQCGACRKFTCYQDGAPAWNCRWAPCTNSGVPTGQITSFEAGHGG